MIIEPDDYRFTMPEIVGESTHRQMNLRNWMARDVIQIGQKHKVGRWLFSLQDIVRIRVIESLTGIAGMAPADANTIADLVVARFRFLVERDAESRYNVCQLFSVGSLVGRRGLLISGAYGALPCFYNEASQMKVQFTDDHLIDFSEYGTAPYLMVPMDEMIGNIVMSFTTSAADEAGEPVNLESFDFIRTSDVDPFVQVWSLNGMISWYGRQGAVSLNHEANTLSPAGKTIVEKIENLTRVAGAKGKMLMEAGSEEDKKKFRAELKSAMDALETLRKEMSGDEE